MAEDDDLYRGVLAYEQTPHHWVPNLNYVPGQRAMYGSSSNTNTWQAQLYVPTGDPDETITDIIGPYSDTRPIKSYITRHRKRYTNLRIVRIEKVSGWEEVDI
jgi:hypothetical protein